MLFSAWLVVWRVVYGVRHDGQVAGVDRRRLQKIADKSTCQMSDVRCLGSQGEVPAYGRGLGARAPALTGKVLVSHPVPHRFK